MNFMLDKQNQQYIYSCIAYKMNKYKNYIYFV
jgi:hypothetical protein